MPPRAIKPKSRASTLQAAPPAESRSFTKIAVAVSAVAAVLGLAIGYFAIIAFRDPDVEVSESTGSVILGMQGATSDPVGIQLDYYTYDGASGQAPYYALNLSLYFPKSDFGKEWVLILDGNARLTGLGGALQDDDLRSCQSRSVTACELGTGRVFGRETRETLSEFGPTGACASVFGPVRVASVDFIDGRAMNQTRDSWINEVRRLPFVPSRGLARSFDEIPESVISNAYKIPPVETCESSSPPGGYELAEASEDPQAGGSSESAWFHGGIAVAYRLNYGIALANAGIGVAGLSFAIFSGFAPLAVQSLFAERRGSKPRPPRRSGRRRRHLGARS